MIKLYYIRITKYPPDRRDKEGRYPGDDWTSISDIGKEYAGCVLTPDLFFACESSYIEIITALVRLQGITNLAVSELEKYEMPRNIAMNIGSDELLYSTIKTGMTIHLEQLPSILRLALRESLWCKLANPLMFIHFGYDMYVYVGCEVNPFALQDTAYKKTYLLKSANPHTYSNDTQC